MEALNFSEMLSLALAIYTT